MRSTAHLRLDPCQQVINNLHGLKKTRPERAYARTK